MSCRAKCPSVNFGQAKKCVVAGNDDVAIAHESDTATDTKPGNSSDHWDRAVVDSSEGGVATLVGADESIKAFGVLHLFDVHPGVKATALGTQDDDSYLFVTTQGRDGVGDLKPFSHGEGIDRRTVHDDLGNTAVVDI